MRLLYTKAPNHIWIKDIQFHNIKIKGDSSQSGEGNALKFIFDIIGTVSKACVEFGAADGHNQSNTLFLEKTGKWKRYLFDIEPYDRHNRKIKNIIKINITAGNINRVFHTAAVPLDIDLISIDIDGNDYWVWQALHDFKPMVVVIEFNQSLGFKEAKTIKYNPLHEFDRTTYFGVSLPALIKLGKQKGYKLVYFTNTNAFFIREDLIPNSPKLLLDGLEPKKSGWPVDKSNRIWITI